MQLQPLSSIPVGTRVRLSAIDGGRLLTRRLLSLGISIGSELEIVNHRGEGVVVARDENRVALGKGVADKLTVETLD